MRPPFRAGAILLAGVALLAPGCNKTTSGPVRIKVAVVSNNTADFWSTAEAGAKKAGQDFDCDVIFRQPPTDAVADQMTIVNDLVRVGVSGIAVSVIQPADQAPALKVIAGKTHFITMDNDSAESGRKCYIGVDNYEAGKAAGRLVKQALPDGGTVALFIGNVSSANAVDRIGGVVDELAGRKDAPRTDGADLGKYKLAGILTDNADQIVAQNKARDMIEKLRGTPNLCFVGLYAYNPKACLLAVKAKEMTGKIKIVGFDGDEATLQGIMDGEIVGTVVQDPFNYGYKSVEILAALARGDASKAVDQTIAHRIVTRDGGPTEVHGKFSVANLKAKEFAEASAAEIAAVKGAK